jgi:hypothetical protein
MSAEDRTGVMDFAAQVNESRERVYTVTGPMTIREDLEKLL